MKEYTENIKKYSETAQKLQQKQKIISISRLIIFVGAVVLLFVFLSKSMIAVGISVFSVLIIAFFVLLKVHLKLKNESNFVKNLIIINKDELKFLKFDFAEKYNGKDFLDYHHPYSFDLDLLGKHSVFQYINRTTTSYGIRKFVSWLTIPSFDKKEIENHQQAINELHEKTEILQHFQAYGVQASNPVTDKDGFEEWLATPNQFLKNKTFNLLKIVLPAITAILLVLSFIQPVFTNVFALSFVANLLVLGIYYKKIKAIHNQLSKKTELLKKYIKQLEIIEKNSYKTEHLQLLKRKIKSQNSPANEKIGKLLKILNAFDTRFNVFLTFILNGLWLFDFWTVLRLEKWKTENSEHFIGWLETIGEFDALVSFAVFAQNNKQNICYPQFQEKDFMLKAKQMSHPLIPEQQRVYNNFEVSGFHNFNVVTGANMAGKSTFLRTVGVNLVLAMAGSPVIAEKFDFQPIKIRTRIKISDSLFKNESYFYAELKRLQEIIEDLENGEKVFILLDEILRGTNSKDKHEGSKKYVEKLLRYKASGIIATHDLVLGKLENEYKNQVQNFCFEVEIENDKLVFDYKLKKGISQKLNASFLMKKMNIIDS